jgi:hypothetical protein
MLSLSKQKEFLALVDSNAQPKAYANQLGMTLDEVRQHFSLIGQYRENCALADKIAELRKSSAPKKVQDKQIEELRKKIKE